MTESELWAVVCTDLHVALGPYTSVGEALAMAERLTLSKACVFMPVPMYAAEHYVETQTKAPDLPTGQYL